MKFVISGRGSFIRCEEGSSSLEIAVLLSTIITCVAVGVCSILTISRKSFSDTAASLGSVDVVESRNDRQNKPQLDSRHTENESGALLIVLIAAVLIGCFAPTLFLMKRRRARVQTDDSNAPANNEIDAPSRSDDAFAKRQKMRRVFENNMSSLLHGSLKARHIMSRQVTSVAADDKLEKVRAVLEEKRIRQVLVQSRDGQLVGVIAKEDILQREGRTASDVMNPDVQTIGIDSDISSGITQIICGRLSCLPVLDSDKKLIGIITVTDFLLAFQCAIRTLACLVDQIQDTPKNLGHATEFSRVAERQVANQSRPSLVGAGS